MFLIGKFNYIFAYNIINKLFMKKLIRDTLSDHTQPSSKRLAGMIGWIVCIFSSLYCLFKGVEAPDIIEVLFYMSSSLLGLDSVVSIFNNRKGNKNE